LGNKNKNLLTRK